MLTRILLIIAVLLLTACDNSTSVDTDNSMPEDTVTDPVDESTLQVAISAPWSISILPQDGGGSLVAAISHDQDYLKVWRLDQDRQLNEVAQADTGFHPDSVRWYDWDGQGQLELLVAVEGDNQIQLWQLNNDVLQRSGVVSVTDPPRTVEAADLDQDGQPDLVVGPYRGERFKILWNEGDFSFEPVFILAESIPSFPRITDWNKDDRPDIVWSNWDTGSIQLALNQGDRRFEVVELFPRSPGAPREVAVGDLNGDSWVDLVTGLEAGQAARVIFNDGKGGATENFQLLPAPVSGYSGVAINPHDNNVTFAASDIDRIVLFQAGDDRWTFRELSTEDFSVDLQFVDADGDGETDLAYTYSGGESFEIIFGPLWEKARAPQAPASPADAQSQDQN